MPYDNRQWLRAVNADDDRRKNAFAARLSRRPAPTPEDLIRELSQRLSSLETQLSQKGMTEDDN